MTAAGKLAAAESDVILAEPVGSCMDISATILQPLKRFHGGDYQLAPFTVLVDPERARDLLSESADEKLSYLFRNQLAEADLVFFTRADLDPTYPDLPGDAAGALSTLTGEGVEQWLSLVLAPSETAGRKLLDVDYGRYAEAEAALGWLNLRARIELDSPRSPSLVVGPLLDELDARLTDAGAQIMHLKVMDDSPAGWIRASLCRNGQDPLVDGDLTASAGLQHDLVINLRALADPLLLAGIVRTAVGSLPGRAEILQEQAFRPAPPRPEHRFANVES